MSEHETPQGSTAEQEGEGAENGKGEEQRIPYSRFEEVNTRAKHAEKELQDLRSKILEFEDRDKSEVERERSARERAESQLGELMGKVTSLEKGAWVRSAAAELHFHDPEDAVQHLRDQLAGLEDSRDAKRLVQKLAGTKKHLVREEKKEERPTIGRMFSGDQVPAQQGNGGQQRTPQQQAAERELAFAEGLRDQLGKYRDTWHNAGGIV